MTPFESKQAAELAATARPLAGPVWVGPVLSAALSLKAGWYVGFPRNIDAKLYGRESAVSEKCH